jgi:hypothetical protein
MSKKRLTHRGAVRVPSRSLSGVYKEASPGHALSNTYRIHGKDLTVSLRSGRILQDTAKTFRGALKRLADK